jgi:hypothetical protein
MILSAQVEFYPPNTQLVDPKRPVPGENPIIAMNFKALPAVGHVIEAPNSSLPSALYRVALVIHTIHGFVYLKAIPA